MTGVAVLTVVLVLVPLVAIFGYLVYRGLGSINWAFLTQPPKPVGEPGGGMANAIVGSGILLAIGSVLGVPVGIAAGIFLAEFGRGTRLANGPARQLPMVERFSIHGRSARRNSPQDWTRD